MPKYTFSIDRQPIFNSQKEIAVYYTHRTEAQVNDDIASNKPVYFFYICNIDITDDEKLDRFFKNTTQPTLLCVDIRGTATTIYKKENEKMFQLH